MKLKKTFDYIIFGPAFLIKGLKSSVNTAIGATLLWWIIITVLFLYIMEN